MMCDYVSYVFHFLTSIFIILITIYIDSGKVIRDIRPISAYDRISIPTIADTNPHFNNIRCQYFSIYFG